MEKKKDSADLLKECLGQIDSDLYVAEEKLKKKDEEEAHICIARARGRVANFLTIMGYL